MTDAPTQKPTTLTEGVLAALDRPPQPLVVPGVGRTVVVGLLTAGLWPAFVLARRWLIALRWSRGLGWHVAEWAQTNLSEADGRKLHDAADAKLSRWLARLAVVLVLVAAVTAVVGVIGGVPWWRFWFADPRSATAVRVYLPLLGGSYLATWLAANLSLRRLNGLAATLGDMTSDYGTLRGRRKRWDWGFGPASLLIGLTMTFLGLPWALPMLLATTAQRRVLTVHGRRVRGRVAGRIREVLEARRPPVAVPLTVGRAEPCVNPLCNERLPSDARHCPRCGAPQRSALSGLLQ